MKINQQIANVYVLERCKETGYIFTPFIYDGVMRTRLNIKCLKHDIPFEWTPSYTKFVNDKSSCPQCAREKLKLSKTNSKENVHENIIKRCNQLGYEYGDYEYIDRHSKIPIICPKHGKWEVSYNNFIHDLNRCPKCSKVGYQITEPGYFYVNKITYDVNVYYKIGISNNFNSRPKRLNENPNSTTENYLLFYSTDGKLIKEFEHMIKNSSGITFGKLLKDEYPDGYTETFDSSDLERIIILCDKLKEYQINYAKEP